MFVQNVVTNHNQWTTAVFDVGLFNKAMYNRTLLQIMLLDCRSLDHQGVRL